MSANTNQDRNGGYINIIANISNRINCCNRENVSDNQFSGERTPEVITRTESQNSIDMSVTEETLEYQE